MMFLPLLTIAQSFEGLKSWQYKEGIKIFYQPNSTVLLNQKLEDEAGFDIIASLETKLMQNSKEIFVVVFSSGPSDDPGFSIYRKEDFKNKKDPIDHFSGLELTIPGNGAVYLSGHTNNMFNMRKKYTYQKGKFVEVKQAFYYVGIKNKAKADFNIYADTNLKSIVAAIKKDSEVEVLINQGDYYLIKTPFGLTGWIKIGNGAMNNEFIQGIFYAGD
jgi:hypothetical protein